MRLLKQIIEKKMSNEQFLSKLSQEDLAYQEHISAYLLSLFYLGLKDKNLKTKISLWQKYVNNSGKEYFLKLLNFKSQEDYIILQAIKKMDIQKEEQSERWSSLFGEFSWAILSFEHEEEQA